jgi:cytochrome P450
LLSGSLPEFRRDMLGLFDRSARDFGDIVSLRLGSRRLYLVNHPDFVEQVLVTASRNFRHTYIRRLMRPLLGDGLLTSEGDFWIRQRRLVQPAFHRQQISAYAEVMVDYTLRMLDAWRDGETRDLHAEMMSLTLEIVARTLFDADAGSSGAREVGDAMEVVLESFRARWESLLALPESVPTPTNLRMRRAVGQLDRIIYGFIAQRRRSREERGDLLSLLLRAQDEDGTSMTDKQLRDEAMTLFLAGHETTANALAWTLFLVSQYPHVEARLHSELREALGERAPSFSDLPQLKYTETVVQEAMRLYPPAFAVSREAIDECEIGGYRIPSRATLLLCQWTIHRDARFFEEPLSFRPERWQDNLQKRLPKFAYFPFGGGLRLCVGNAFAMMEATLVLATLAQKFRFTLAPGQNVEPWPSITLRPRNGIRMTLQRRA